MARFSYVAKNRQSQITRGIIEGNTQEEAIRKVQQQGLFIVSITRSKEEAAATAKLRKAAHGGIKLSDLATFARQLSILLDAGVTLLRSLEIVSVQVESRHLQDILKRVTKNVEGGLSLTEALAKYPKIFDSMWIGLIETGEASGNLAGVLDKLAYYLEMRMEFVSNVVTALVYPIVLFVAAIGALFFFTVFIIPKFAEIFDQFDITLPILTQFMFKFGGFLQNNIVWVVVGIVAAIFGFDFYRKTPIGKATLDNLTLKLPVLKKFFYTSALEKFASEATILLESGVPIVYALEVTQRSLSNVVLKSVIGHVKEKVKGGSSLSDQLAITGFFPPMIIEMVRVGEEVGNLPEMFGKISTHYQKELATSVKRFVSMFEPLMIVFMGGVIGAIVISLFMPLFQIATAG